MRSAASFAPQSFSRGIFVVPDVRSSTELLREFLIEALNTTLNIVVVLSGFITPVILINELPPYILIASIP